MDAEEMPVFKTSVFNYDVYKIFTRYMRNPAHKHTIRLLPRDTTEKIEYYRNEYIPIVSYDA